MENSKPLSDYLTQHDADESWREGAIRYMVRTSEDVFDQTTCKKLWTISFITTIYATRQVSALISFFETKWQEFCNLDGALLNEEQKDCAMASGHALLGILSHLRTDRAVEYLEQILQVCQARNHSLETAARLNLAHAKLLIGRGAD